MFWWDWLFLGVMAISGAILTAPLRHRVSKRVYLVALLTVLICVFGLIASSIVNGDLMSRRTVYEPMHMYTP